MNLILDNAHFDLITLSLAAVFLLTIKNKIINVILSLSKKTSTVYDELLLHSVKTPSSYLIIIGYLLLILNYLKNEEKLLIMISIYHHQYLF